MAAKTAQEVRIIGGKWKGRKLRFTGDASLRPTLGRTRETLFNWLRPYIHQQACLDLFAGSGVLGLEALSQGAAHCTFVDSNKRTIHALTQNIATLSATAQASVQQTDALKFLDRSPNRFDVIFLDPPFGQPQLLERVLNVLRSPTWQPKFLYVESPARASLDPIIDLFPGAVLKTTRAGDTQALLINLMNSSAA